MSKGMMGDETGYSIEGMNFMVRGPKKSDEESPLEWLPDTSWAMCRTLSEMEGFETLCGDIEENGPRFLEWFNLSDPEVSERSERALWQKSVKRLTHS